MSKQPKRPREAVEIKVGGNTYSMRTTDPASVQRAAARVDAMLDDVRSPGVPADDFRLALLAAMNLVGEHDEDRDAWRADATAILQQSDSVEQRLRALRRTIEERQI